MAEEQLLYVEKGVLKIDAGEKVTGEGVYSVDMSLPHIIFGKDPARYLDYLVQS